MRDEALPGNMKRVSARAYPLGAVVRFTYRTDTFMAATTLLGVLPHYEGSAFGYGSTPT